MYTAKSWLHGIHGQTKEDLRINEHKRDKDFALKFELKFY